MRKIIFHVLLILTMGVGGWVYQSVALGDQNHPRLDSLFEELRATNDQEAAQEISDEIWRLWREVDDPEAAELFALGQRAMTERHYRTAYRHFSELVTTMPDFAEGWNARATLLYQVESYDESISDIKETLQREPRHFGALAGLGFIFLRQHQFGPAINVFRAALEINPHMPQIHQALKQLELREENLIEQNTI